MNKLAVLSLLLVLLIPVNTASAQSWPDWFSQVEQWTSEGLISQQEFNNAKEFLIEQGILPHDESNQRLDFVDCVDLDRVTMNVSPIEIASLQLITPMGRVWNTHVTPTDHQYWSLKGGINKDYSLNNAIRVDLRSPADGIVTDIERFKENDYRMVIQHSCSFFSYYIHLAELSEKILNQVSFSDSDQHQFQRANVPVKQGEVIGKVTGKFDFSVEDKKVTLTGFISPERYDGEPWKIHTVDPFDYFAEPIRTLLIEKTIRTEFPVGGKIDYDVQGRLVGNWFKLGTSYKPAQEDYWQNHLSIAYDHIDPSQIRISIGDFMGEPKQFGVIGNEPDPASVSVQSGLIKYELALYDYFIGNSNEYWDRITAEKNLTSKNLENKVQGVILIQMLEDSKIKVEVFSGKNSSQVLDFTEDAEIYDR